MTLGAVEDPGVTIDDAWDHLRQHVEWTGGLPSVVVVTFDRRTDRDDLLSRIKLLADRGRIGFVEADLRRDSHVRARLDALLPRSGIVHVPLSFDDPGQRARALAALNEMRARLASPRQGTLIISGPASVRREAATNAADLWSVRSFAPHVSGTGVPTASESVATTDPDVSLSGVLVFADVFLPAAERTGHSREVLRMLGQAARRAVGDVAEARRLARSAALLAPKGSGDAMVTALAEAELAGMDSDWPMLDIRLRESLQTARHVSSAARGALLDSVRIVAIRYGDNDVAMAAAEESLDLRRDLASRLGTPEALRDLSVSLNNAAAVARAQGEDPAPLVSEALELARAAFHRDPSRTFHDWLNRVERESEANSQTPD